MKFDNGKASPTLTYFSLLEAISVVRKYGAAKYGGTEDWRMTEDKMTRYRDAAIRHLFASMLEVNDPESGLDHLAHAATNIMFLIEDAKTHELARRAARVTVTFAVEDKPKDGQLDLGLLARSKQLLRETAAELPVDNFNREVHWVAVSPSLWECRGTPEAKCLYHEARHMGISPVRRLCPKCKGGVASAGEARGGK